MKKVSIIFLLPVCFLSMVLSAAAELSAGAGRLDDPTGFVAGQILVKFRSEKRVASLENYRQHRRIGQLNLFRSIGVDHLKLPEEMSVHDALEIFRSDPDVVYAEPNYYRYAAAVPYDEHFDLLWGMHNIGQNVNGTAGTADADIDAPEAWDITTGSADVLIAVIDSGLDFSHPDLEGNVWTNPNEIADNGLDDDGNGYIDDIRGWDFVYDDNAPSSNDSSGHGTHVAGTAAAAGNSDPSSIEGSGVAGVSWQSQIMSLRTLDALGAGDTADAILAFEYASSMNAHIINCSWGGTGYSQALKDAIDATSALVVCAAGNSGTDSDTAPHYPAAYDSPNIISVAATTADDSLAVFSNFGNESVDLAAPGVDIYSCAPARTTLWADNFDDGSISNWTSGGPNNSWGLTGLESFNIPYSITDSPNDDYSQHTNSWIRTPELDISGARNSRFEFKIKGRSEPGYDRLFVETSTDGAVWTASAVKISGVGILFGVSGTISEWTDAYADLSIYDGLSTLYVRFSLITDWTNNYDGWYIDDVTVTAASDSYTGNEYRFLSGTSMAVPHVTGAAALVKALNPALSAASVKSILMATVDTKTGLSTLLASGGRLNAFEAVSSPDSGSLQFEAAAYRVRENDSSATVTVTRAEGSVGQVSAGYQSDGGTASEGIDFTELAGSLFWADGDMGSRTISVGIMDDTEHENSETLEITLTTTTGGAALGNPSKTVLTILDDDNPASPESSNFWLLVLPSILNGY